MDLAPISSTSLIRFEVKPAKLAAEANIQLHEVIDKIKDGLVAYYEEKSIERGISLPFDTTSIVVRGSPWRPRDDELIVMPKAAAWVKENAWICFRPTVRPLSGTRVNKDDQIQADGRAGNLGENGVLYDGGLRWSPILNRLFRRFLPLTLKDQRQDLLITIERDYSTFFTAVPLPSTSVVTHGHRQQAPD
jgi:hypothetical protein